MPLSLIKRSTNGAPITAAQNDSNMTNIETAVNGNSTSITSITSNYTTTAGLNAMFEGLSGGKQQVDWARLTSKPAILTQKYPFRAYKNAASQSVTSTGTVVQVTLDAEAFDPGSAFASNVFTAAVAGYYQINGSTLIQLSSGSPTNISIASYIRVNGAVVDSDTMGTTSIGTQIYRHSIVVSLNAGDTVDLALDFTWTGSATWTITSSSNQLSGFLIQ